MKERPILMSAQMVRAILNGTKTQTRRVMHRQPYVNGYGFDGQHIKCHNDSLPASALLMDIGQGRDAFSISDVEDDLELYCPHGVPGDHLWVREAWAHDAETLEQCRAAHEDVMTGPSYGPYYRATEIAPHTLRWRPSIHMPRWASRITLAITDVRVERLQDISEKDARAEGLTPLSSGADRTWTIEADPRSEHKTARQTYRWLWEELNGPGSWDANPFVWAISFKRIDEARA